MNQARQLHQVNEAVSFNYDQAFSRNLGWVTESEQQTLKTKKVAIAGVGGVGGQYCEVLARLGVSRFHISDPDSFEVVNFNRQNCSGVSTIGSAKVEVLRKKILDINPEAQIEVFAEGVRRENLEDFLKGVDLYLDGLDFFVLNERLWLFDLLKQKNIPALTVAPIGMGASLIVFKEGSMSFRDYFGYHEQHSDLQKALRFMIGLAPSLISRKYQVDRSRVNFSLKKAPSMPMGVYLCGGVAGTTALKLLLNRGPVAAAPWSLHYDAYLQVYKKKYTWLGAANPLQKLKLWIALKIILK